MLILKETLLNLPQPLTQEEESKLIRSLQNGDMNARSKLIERNTRLVLYVANKFANNAISVHEELCSVGFIGLIKGIDSYTQEKGTRLASYLRKCIENEILMYYRNNKKYNKNISLEETLLQEETKIKLANSLEDKKQNLETTMCNNAQLESIVECILNKFNERSRFVILSVLAGDKQDDISKQIHNSQSYTSRILCKSRKMLSKYIKEKRTQCRYTVSISEMYYVVSFDRNMVREPEELNETLKQKAKELKIQFEFFCKGSKCSIRLPNDTLSFKIMIEFVNYIEGVKKQ